MAKVEAVIKAKDIGMESYLTRVNVISRGGGLARTEGNEHPQMISLCAWLQLITCQSLQPL